MLGKPPELGPMTGLSNQSQEKESAWKHCPIRARGGFQRTIQSGLGAPTIVQSGPGADTQVVCKSLRFTRGSEPQRTPRVRIVKRLGDGECVGSGLKPKPGEAGSSQHNWLEAAAGSGSRAPPLNSRVQIRVFFWRGVGSWRSVSATPWGCVPWVQTRVPALCQGVGHRRPVLSCSHFGGPGVRPRPCPVFWVFPCSLTFTPVPSPDPSFGWVGSEGLNDHGRWRSGWGATTSGDPPWTR